MEVVWHGRFEELFQWFPHHWTLTPIQEEPTNWNMFKDSAKVRFCCEQCGHAWTSMKGRVFFWYKLDSRTGKGSVMFRLYGQQCRTCKNGKFEHAMWYPEEVVKVVENIYHRIGQMYYGWAKPPVRVDRRPGRPRNQHDQELCQACKEGICTEPVF